MIYVSTVHTCEEEKEIAMGRKSLKKMYENCEEEMRLGRRKESCAER